MKFRILVLAILTPLIVGCLPRAYDQAAMKGTVQTATVVSLVETLTIIYTLTSTDTQTPRPTETNTMIPTNTATLTS